MMVSMSKQAAVLRRPVRRALPATIILRCLRRVSVFTNSRPCIGKQVCSALISFHMQQRSMVDAALCLHFACRRGSYSRDNCAKPTTHAEQAWKHWQKVTEFATGNPCLQSCPFGRRCGLNISPALMITAHEHSYGKKTARSVASHGMQPEFSVEFTKMETMRRWRVLAASAMSWTLGDQPKLVERLTVCDHGPVCSAFWRTAYGIPEGTAHTLLAAARARTLTLDLDDGFATVRERYQTSSCRGMLLECTTQSLTLNASIVLCVHERPPN